MNNLRERMTSLISEMSRGAYEREEVIALSLLSAFAGESIFLLGLPGVGKSMVARRLKSAFKDSTCFEYLMSRFSTPDEIFGPVSISKLKDEDTYERCVDGYLPTADVIFLDEIWKAGPAIQNSLLTALNEKIFHNGKADIDLPLKGIIAASNELPAEDEGLEALWDRFLLRYIVNPINEKDAFMRLIGGRTDKFDMPGDLPLTGDEYRQIQEGIKGVDVPVSVMEALYELRSTYARRFANHDEDDENETTAPYISDRRWKKIVGVLKASAYLNGRASVDFSDCLLLEHMLWDKDDQLKTVKTDVSDMVVSGFTRQRHRGEKDALDLETVLGPQGEVCNVVMVANDEMLIKAEEYARLTEGRSAYGRFASGNLILVDFESGDFRLKCERPGSLTLNTFNYPMRRKARAKSFEQENLDAIPVAVGRIIANNIFLRDSIDDYPFLKAAVNRFKGYKR